MHQYKHNRQSIESPNTQQICTNANKPKPQDLVFPLSVPNAGTNPCIFHSRREGKKWHWNGLAMNMNFRENSETTTTTTTTTTTPDKFELPYEKPIRLKYNLSSFMPKIIAHLFLNSTYSWIVVKVHWF